MVPRIIKNLRRSTLVQGTLRTCLLMVLTLFTYRSPSSFAAATAVVPDERDRRVLETLLLHLLGDSKFDMTGASTNGEVIVLHTRTPEKTGFLQADQMRSPRRRLIREDYIKLLTSQGVFCRSRVIPHGARTGIWITMVNEFCGKHKHIAEGRA
jgi:hypothetical protein